MPGMVWMTSLILFSKCLVSCPYCSWKVHLKVTPVLRYHLDKSYQERMLSFLDQDTWLPFRQADAVLVLKELPLTRISLWTWTSDVSRYLSPMDSCLLILFESVVLLEHWSSYWPRWQLILSARPVVLPRCGPFSSCFGYGHVCSQPWQDKWALYFCISGQEEWKVAGKWTWKHSRVTSFSWVLIFHAKLCFLVNVEHI